MSHVTDTPRTLDDLVARCKCSVTITINGNTDNYADRIEYIRYELSNRQWGGATDEELLAAPNIYDLQFYPDTPIGFYLVAGDSLDSVVRQAHAILDEEKK